MCSPRGRQNHCGLNHGSFVSKSRQAFLNLLIFLTSIECSRDLETTSRGSNRNDSAAREENTMSTAVILAWMLLQFPGSTGFHTQVDHRVCLQGSALLSTCRSWVAAAAKRAAAYQEKQFEIVSITW